MNVSVSVRNPKYELNMELSNKLTYIIGESGNGKSTLIRYLSERTANTDISVSNGFDLVVLSKNSFDAFLKRTGKAVLKNNEKYKNRYEYLKENFPIDESIIIIDDEDFIRSHSFSEFYNADTSNYYIIINRTLVGSMNYSPDDVFRFTADGKYHRLEPYYDNNFFGISDKIDKIIVEGQGSDHIFFSNMFKDTEYTVENPGNTGKDGLINYLTQNIIKFENKNILLLVDYCSFGFNIEKLYRFCEDAHISFIIDKRYKSFEYMLLTSKFVNDTELEKYISENIIKFPSLERLYLKRIQILTNDTLYSYSKSKSEFPVCYYMSCCNNSRYRNELCDKRTIFYGKNKFKEMLSETPCAFLLELL